MINDTFKYLGISVARQSRRRALVLLYWCLFLPFSCWAMFIGEAHHGGWNSSALNLAVQMILFIPALLGGVRAGGLVKPFRGIHFVPLQEREEIQTLFGKPQTMFGTLTLRDMEMDEREVALRNQVHFAAYSVMRFAALAVLVLIFLVGINWPSSLPRLGPILLYLLTFALWILPQSIILWMEPDMEQEA